MTLAQRRRDHQLSHLLPDGHILRIAKELLGGAVELHDPPLVVHRDHRIQGGGEHGALAGLAHPDGLLGADGFHELSDLAPERLRKRVELGVAFADLAREQLDHADALVPVANRKGQPAPQAHGVQLLLADEGAARQDVAEPERMALLPHGAR